MRPAEALSALPPSALLLEPRAVYDPALVGVTSTPNDAWARKTDQLVAVYDTDKCIAAIMSWLECDFETAAEWFGFNTSGAWVGEGTPTFV